MADSVWTETEFSKFRIFRLVGAKLVSEKDPLVFEGLYEFPAVDLIGSVVLARWGSGYYRATLWNDAEGGLSGRGQTHNVFVDEHGVASRQVRQRAPRKAPPPGALDATIVDASAVEGEPDPVRPLAQPSAIVAAMPPSFSLPTVQVSPDRRQRIRESLSVLSGDKAIDLYLDVEDYVHERAAKHEAIRFAKTTETFDHASKFQRSALDRVLADMSELNEHRATLEIEHETKRLELKVKKQEIEAARGIEDDANEAADRISELEESLEELRVAKTPAAQTAAGNKLLPFFKLALPELLKLAPVRAWLSTLHPNAAVMADAMAPAALESIAASMAEEAAE